MGGFSSLSPPLTSVRSFVLTISRMSLSIPPTHLSFSKTLTFQNPLFLSNLTLVSPKPITIVRKTTIIRMGGGPRTYPGGVSKWQWKRMQKKKAKQLLKARLSRERQIYEMRKRAELKAAVSELERPWEVVERAPKLFSVGADEQVKVLADRFQKPGGFDLWSERDGPQLFETPDGIPSARFFPKGVVHSIKPYGKVEGFGELGEGMGDSGSESENKSENESESSNRLLGSGEFLGRGDGDLMGMENGLDLEHGLMENSIGKLGMDKWDTKRIGGKYGKNRRRFGSGVGALDSGQVGSDREKIRVGATMHSGGDSRIGYRGKGDDRVSYNRDKRGVGGNRANYRSKGDGRISSDSEKIRMGDPTNGGGESRIGYRGNSDNRIGYDCEKRRVGDNGSNYWSKGDGRVGSNREKRRERTAMLGGRDSRIDYRSKSDGRIRKDEALENWGGSESEVYDMSLQHNGSYGYREENERFDLNSWEVEAFEFQSF